MNLVENPLKRPKRKAMVEEETMDEEATNEEAIVEEGVNTKVELTRAIKAMVKIFYDREHLKKEGLIYEFDEM